MTLSSSRRLWIPSILATLATSLIVACSAPPSSEQSVDSSTEAEATTEGEPIKIGLLQPLTGPVAANGIAIRDAAVIAVEEINNEGGVDGRPIELIIEDTANDPAQCTSAATKVVTRDEVEAIIGAWGSSCTLAVIPIIQQYEVPLLVETSSSFKITDPEESGNEWTFRLAPPTPLEAWAVRDDLVKTLGFNNVFFLAVNNDWGRGAIASYSPHITENGGEIVGEEYFEQAEVDFKPLLSKVKAAGADSAIVTTSNSQIALILEQAKTLGIDLKILATGGSWPEKVVELAGLESSSGSYHTVFFPGAYDSSLSKAPDQAAEFTEKWEEQGYKFSELGEAGRGYDAVYTMEEALDSLDGDINHETIRDALKSVKYQGVMYGDISFGDWQGLINQNVPPVFIGMVKEDGSVDFVVQSE
ncbi:MAG: ABC transporter substrate-binding protein [Elainellaceae cyanobacterium]